MIYKIVNGNLYNLQTNQVLPINESLFEGINKLIGKMKNCCNCKYYFKCEKLKRCDKWELAE